jgi:hypothetical protein
MADDLTPSQDFTAAIVALSAVTEAGVEIDGELQVAESTWVIYGHTSYDGEIIVGEYHDAAEADEVFHAAPRRATDQHDTTSPPQQHDHLGTEGSS